MQKTSEDHAREQREREVLNTLATMPEQSTATVLGVRVGRMLCGFYITTVDGSCGHVTSGRDAAHSIVSIAEAREKGVLN